MWAFLPGGQGRGPFIGTPLFVVTSATLPTGLTLVLILALLLTHVIPAESQALSLALPLVLVS